MSFPGKRFHKLAIVPESPANRIVPQAWDQPVVVAPPPAQPISFPIERQARDESPVDELRGNFSQVHARLANPERAGNQIGLRIPHFE